MPLNVYLLLLMFLQEIFIKIYAVSSTVVGTLESKISSIALFSWSRCVKEQMQYGGTGVVIEVHPDREVGGRGMTWRAYRRKKSCQGSDTGARILKLSLEKEPRQEWQVNG